MNKEELRQMYCIQRMTQKEIATYYNCGSTKVYRYLKKFGIQKPLPILSKFKTCYSCKEVKENLEYNKKHSNRDGLQKICKICSRLRSRLYYAECGEVHKQNVIKHNRINAEINRKEMILYLRKHPCVDCGYSDPRALEFDHVREVKRSNISAMLTGYSWKSILTEIQKCDVRCGNCHQVKTAIERNYYTERLRKWERLDSNQRCGILD